MINVKDVMIRTRDRRIAELETELRATQVARDTARADNERLLLKFRDQVRTLMTFLNIEECDGDRHCD